MSKFIQTNTIKDRLKCPKSSCGVEFYKIRHKAENVVCPNCGWDGSFDYLTKPEQGE
jgi:predicted RNA-binding Zn-ribbon protein involved in translation (DUF1610 family)